MIFLFCFFDCLVHCLDMIWMVIHCGVSMVDLEDLKVYHYYLQINDKIFTNLLLYHYHEHRFAIGCCWQRWNVLRERCSRFDVCIASSEWQFANRHTNIGTSTNYDTTRTHNHDAEQQLLASAVRWRLAARFHRCCFLGYVWYSHIDRYVLITSKTCWL